MKNKIIHHMRFKFVNHGNNTVEYYDWCGKKYYNDRVDDLDAVSTPINPSLELDPETDISAEARAERVTYRSCTKCLKEKTKYFGQEYMDKLGYRGFK